MSAVEPAVPVARRRLLPLAALAILLCLAALLLLRLYAGDAARIPSALIGKPAPALNLGGLSGPGVADADLRAGHVTVINFFASWCLPCHEEHSLLMELAADKDLSAAGVRLVGVAQKDDPENARRFLGAGGNPYAQVGLDPDGRAGIDWGVYGVPETFVVKGDGTIAHKFIGPLTLETLMKELKPQIEKALN
jgi:cytochrome c biogenesis protein CcmG/thiol:disulfide interchange protein DsbE